MCQSANLTLKGIEKGCGGREREKVERLNYKTRQQRAPFCNISDAKENNTLLDSPSGPLESNFFHPVQLSGKQTLCSPHLTSRSNFK